MNLASQRCPFILPNFIHFVVDGLHSVIDVLKSILKINE